MYRLSISEHHDSFVLKGGMLVTLWIGDENRVYDLWAILKSQSIDENELAGAVAATFSRRETEIPTTVPAGLTDQFSSDPQKERQWATYAASIGLDGLSLDDAINLIWTKLSPACKRLRR